MSDIFCIASTPEVALSSGTLKTVVQILAPSNQRVRVLGWGVFFDGTSATAAPVEVQLVRQSTAGVMTTLTPVQTRPVAESILTTALLTATSEPTTTAVVDVMEVHPQGGYEVVFSPGNEIIVSGGGRLAITCMAPSAVNVRAKIRFEE